MSDLHHRSSSEFPCHLLLPNSDISDRVVNDSMATLEELLHMALSFDFKPLELPQAWGKPAQRHQHSPGAQPLPVLTKLD